MYNEAIYSGEQNLYKNVENVEGSYIEIEGDLFYRISNFDKMDPFFINIVSGSDHWIYISSRGGITAGRKNPDNSLFPYYTDDIIHESGETTGSKTIIKVTSGEKTYLWEPLSEKYEGIYHVTRNIYKNIPGTKILFEETNHKFNLTYQYCWTTSEKFGFVKTSGLKYNGKQSIKVELLDGIMNILPAGVYQQMQTEFSTLLDGYKKNELERSSGIGIYALSSLQSDRAEPGEALFATLVWSSGINVEKYLLSSGQLPAFRKNMPIKNESEVKGIRGAYFINSTISLKPEEQKKWFITAEINQNIGDLIHLKKLIGDNRAGDLLLTDINLSTERLKKIVSQGDGLQLTGKKLNSSRHFANTLFNLMRGGIFDNSYLINKADFILFLGKTNPYVLEANKEFINTLKNEISHSALIKAVRKQGDKHFTKLALEYLPLTFSRRHGDPSRPWNRFSIEIKDKKNEKILNYQGNWRDIFQNWEALALSYPGFIESMITKFLNASTADGYNPYRVTREGFDWEVQEPHNPWSNIGYWGDHQIIYLLKLLELSRQFNPGKLEEFINEEIFSYANLPYRIKSYNDILKDPQSTIEFDEELDSFIRKEMELHGADSAFLKKADHTLVQVNMVEKLLITLLVKLSNFIPGGGIWLNTQRPEWNDANNALVGNGISMVTVYYIRRYLSFMKDFIKSDEERDYILSKEAALFFNDIFSALNYARQDNVSLSDNKERKIVVDRLGNAGSDYRTSIYNKGFSGEKKKISGGELSEFFNVCLEVTDGTIRANKRGDDLYHSYNIINFQGNEIKVTHLYEMLEGQVAVLSSGILTLEETIKLLSALRKSKLYRKDQNSYILYPEKRLPSYMEKNNIPRAAIDRSELLLKLVSSENREIVYQDEYGQFHFQADIINANHLKNKLDEITEPGLRTLAGIERDIIAGIYEEIFNHKEFTGRANTFYKYEGLGSIYWHMVSKLLLAVQEVYFSAAEKSTDKNQLLTLRKFYYEIKEGIGVNKSPELYGAFPTDPYSHTPSFAGVQQPGMTGQVKEDFISRMRELGVHVENGRIIFRPELLKTEEFLNSAGEFIYYNQEGEKEKTGVGQNSCAFTYCQVPFIYNIADENRVVIHSNGSEKVHNDGMKLDSNTSRSIFNREGKIRKVEIFINRSSFID